MKVSEVLDHVEQAFVSGGASMSDPVVVFSLAVTHNLLAMMASMCAEGETLEFDLSAKEIEARKFSREEAFMPLADVLRRRAESARFLRALEVE